MKTLKKSVYTSPLLESIPKLIHGFSTKAFGDMRDGANRSEFIKTIHGKPEGIVWMVQVHKNHVHSVTEHDVGKEIPNTDGLVYKFDPRLLIQPILTVHVADCIPLLVVDPVKKIIGSAHAGWKSTVGHIAQLLVSEMKKMGSDPNDIRAVIGPHISPYCYEIEEERANTINSAFGKNTGVVIHRDGKWFADIGEGNLIDLLRSGVRENNIDFDRKVCTFCQDKELFSYRKSGKENTGEILGAIGWK